MTIITLALVWKHQTGQRELRILSESMTGKKKSDWRQKQPELIRKQSGTNIKKPRLSARFWQNLAKTTTSLGQ
jgi:hypothetical protein